MAAIATLALEDSDAVSQNFLPQSINGGIAMWRADSTYNADFVKRAVITASLRPGSASSPNNYNTRVKRKVVVKVKVPYATGFSSVAGNTIFDSIECDVTFTTPIDAPLGNIKDCYSFVYEALNTTQIASMAKLGDMVY